MENVKIPIRYIPEYIDIIINGDIIIREQIAITINILFCSLLFSCGKKEDLEYKAEKNDILILRI